MDNKYKITEYSFYSHYLEASLRISGIWEHNLLDIESLTFMPRIPFLLESEDLSTLNQEISEFLRTSIYQESIRYPTVIDKV